MLISVDNRAAVLTSSLRGDARGTILYTSDAIPKAIGQRRVYLSDAVDLMEKIIDDVMLSSVIVYNRCSFRSVSVDAGSLLLATEGRVEDKANVGWIAFEDGVERQNQKMKVSMLLSMLPEKLGQVPAKSERYVVVADALSLFIAIAIETARLTDGELMYAPYGHCVFLSATSENDIHVIVSDPLGCGWRDMKSMWNTPQNNNPNYWLEVAVKTVSVALFCSPRIKQLHEQFIIAGPKCAFDVVPIPNFDLKVWSLATSSIANVHLARVSVRDMITVTISVDGTSPAVGDWLAIHFTTMSMTRFASPVDGSQLMVGGTMIAPRFETEVAQTPAAKRFCHQINTITRNFDDANGTRTENNPGMVNILHFKNKYHIQGSLDRLALCLSALVVHQHVHVACKRHPFWIKLIKPQPPHVTSENVTGAIEGLSPLTHNAILLLADFRKDGRSYDLWFMGRGETSMEAIHVVKKSTVVGSPEELAAPVFCGLRCPWANARPEAWFAPPNELAFTPWCIYHDSMSSVHLYEEKTVKPVDGASCLTFVPFLTERGSLEDNHWGQREMKAASVDDGGGGGGEQGTGVVHHPLIVAAITSGLMASPAPRARHVIVNKIRKARLIARDVEGEQSFRVRVDASSYNKKGLIEKRDACPSEVALESLAVAKAMDGDSIINGKYVPRRIDPKNMIGHKSMEINLK